MYAPDAAYGYVVGAGIAKGRIASIDVTRARAAPGVLAVVTSADLAGAVRPAQPNPVEGADVVPVPHPVLASGTVRYVGEPIAAVLATDRAAAEDAADLIVMGTHGRRGLSHALSGSVAEAVLRQSRCPVLTVRSPKYGPGHRRVLPAIST